MPPVAVVVGTPGNPESGTTTVAPCEPNDGAPARVELRVEQNAPPLASVSISRCWSRAEPTSRSALRSAFGVQRLRVAVPKLVSRAPLREALVGDPQSRAQAVGLHEIAGSRRIKPREHRVHNNDGRARPDSGRSVSIPRVHSHGNAAQLAALVAYDAAARQAITEQRCVVSTHFRVVVGDFEQLVSDGS
eukprot:2398431-Prymnesium_polylepis.3